ncbi:hypothetical protein N7448_010365 [Penicillium atrosanguineum]|uniref:uncharacterized protein n=1 Tax=Penicillium atrosanguineum TaxID=1132637 RepID=UPI00239A2215|nr:uncharacterized protein N7443_007589 [Penicillium atrosanguineum]KAJ5119696.1 hypothetical protein N7448_010365 [Penicillium atrosanguineum]KAJ5296696.1 hypothetical protein N7443_007589 [Penicillium atrosanguineum]
MKFYSKYASIDLSSFSQVNHICKQVGVPILYRNLTLTFEAIQSQDATLSKVTDAPLGSHFKKYARRLSVVCIELPADCEFEQAQAWKLEPWAISMATDRKPATRKGFLEHYMTSCYSPSGGYILSSVPRRVSETRNWAPAVSLIVSLDRLEQFDFVTSNDFTTSLMEAFSHYLVHSLQKLRPYLTGTTNSIYIPFSYRAFTP